MESFAEWKEQQARNLAERQALVEQARREWVGRGVWYRPPIFHEGRYAEVERVDDMGMVYLFLGYDQMGRRLGACADVLELGRSVTLLDA